MEDFLSAGTVLDERYRIDRVLGRGGFGITYSAENIRLGLNVAIKELFWQGHCARNTSMAVITPESAEEAQVFETQKKQFLREARILKDFSDLPGIVHVLDYFEENGTAYIVMEYLEGETLTSYVEKHGNKLNAEVLLRRIMPLIESLSVIHRNSVIHRDISPDNIIVTPNGVLKLIDFGAARQYNQENMALTTITRACYAPCEQYDSHEKQGPWTDVYALCATCYFCIVGKPPVSSVMRLLLDELKSPSQEGVQIDPRYEKIIMKGLAVNPKDRWQSMEDLLAAISDVLPEKKNPGRRTIVALTGVIVCFLIILGVGLYINYHRVNKFNGIETERLRWSINENITAAEYTGILKQVESWLGAFAGADNYIMDVDGMNIDITMPLSLYAGQKINETTMASYIEHDSNGTVNFMTLDTQIKANWEDPGASVIAGKNQVLPNAFHEETLIVSCGWSQTLTAGQRASILVDLKTRLDGLETPYAFGTLYGDSNQIVFRISPQCIGPAVLDILMYPSAKVEGESDVGSFSVHYSQYEGQSSLTFDRENRSVQYTRLYDFSQDLEKLSRILLQNEENKVYLRTYKNGFVLAQADLTEPALAGTMKFEALSDVSFLDSAFNHSSSDGWLFVNQISILDEYGNTLFGEDMYDHYGVKVQFTEKEERLFQTLKRIEENEGFHCGLYTVSGQFFLELGLSPDERMPEKVAEIVSMLLERYSLGELVTGRILLIRLIDEARDETCQLRIHLSYDTDTNMTYRLIFPLIRETERVKPYIPALKNWWEKFDAESYGLQKGSWRN